MCTVPASSLCKVTTQPPLYFPTDISIPVDCVRLYFLMANAQWFDNATAALSQVWEKEFDPYVKDRKTQDVFY